MGSPVITVTHIADPGCPWAYSALPAITTLRWRYGGQLDWRIVTIGLAESGADYEQRGYTPARMASTPVSFARLGMPFGYGVRERVLGTGQACRAVVSARLRFGEERAYSVLRALSFAWFTTELLLDEPEGLTAALAEVRDGAEIVAGVDADDTEEAYQQDREAVRDAAGSPSSLQQRTAQTDGSERYTAPTLLLDREGAPRLEAGGHQPLGAYDVLVANLAPELELRAPAGDPLELLEEFPDGLSTHEMATAMAGHDAAPDDSAVTARLIELAGDGTVTRSALGANALWRLAA